MSSSPDSITGNEKPSQTMHELSRSMTVQLSPDQYERLFFQPNAAKGDLAKRFANPTLIGVLGFLIPFGATIFSLLNFQGSSAGSVLGVSGSYFFLGGIAMNLAGIFEFVLGNTFPCALFIVYGSHWCALGYVNAPQIGVVASYGAEGALNQEYNAGQGNYNVIMALVSFVFLCGALRTNVPFVLAFFGLIFLFSFLAAGYYQLGYNATAAGAAHAFYYFKIGGGFGMITTIMGFYLALIQACASTGVPCPLPVFDLSTKVFPNSEARLNEHAGNVKRNPSGHDHS